MIGHIFRKDAKLLWRYVAGVAAFNLVRLVLSTAVIGRTPARGLLESLLGFSLIATAILVVIVVQTDAVPGLRQDWLVRPVRRTDLLLSKVLFVLLLVQGPIFVMDLCGGLAEGLPVGPVAGAAVGRSVWMILSLVLPMVAFATLTRTLTDAVVAGLLGALCASVFSIALTGQRVSGLAWISGTLEVACLLLGAAVVLRLQYYRRKTTVSRWIAGAAIIASQLAFFLPWQPAFAIEERLSAKPADAESVQISVGPSGRRRFDVLAGVNAGLVLVTMPIAFSGLDAREKEVIFDRVTARVIEHDGRVTEVRQPWDNAYSFGHSALESLAFPGDLIGRLKGQTARLEVDYSVTLVEPGARESLPLNGAPVTDTLGKCDARADFETAQVEVRCRIPGIPPCERWSLDGTSSPAGRRMTSECTPDYSPWFNRLGMGAVNSYYDALPLVGDVQNARVTIQEWRPVAHFTRHVTVPDFHLDAPAAQ